MRALLASARSLWRSHPARLPRPILFLLGFALLLAMAVVAVDFQREGLRLQGRLRGAEARLAEVRRLAGALAEQRRGAGTSGGTSGVTSGGANTGSLLARTDAALRTVDLGAGPGSSGSGSGRLEPQGTAVVVELGAHDWPQFARLLDELARQGIVTEQAHVEAVEAEAGIGQVRARLTLTQTHTP